MVSDVGVTEVAVTAEIVGAVLVPPHVKLVIEKGGRVMAVLGLKLGILEEVVDTTLAASLLSVGFTEVSCCTATVVPLGTAPAKFTCSA
jgi:hypothetical protein